MERLPTDCLRDKKESLENFYGAVIIIYNSNNAALCFTAVAKFIYQRQ